MPVAEEPDATTADPVLRQTQTPTVSLRVPATAGEVLDRGELSRLRMFHVFGVFAPVGAVVMSLLMGGDPFARYLFWIGAGMISGCNVVLTWLTLDAKRYEPTAVGLMWIISTAGVQGAVYYFGPFSAVVMVDMLGIVFISLGRVRWTAAATACVCIGGHLALAVPMTLGWMHDPGVLTSMVAGRTQLVVAETLIVMFLASGYALGRWARKTNSTALAELQSAMRLIGDQQQALAEVVDDAAKAKRVNEGRWTGQAMGSYRLGLVIGRGAMGEVYEAIGNDGGPAAVKLVSAQAASSPAHLERFHREMEVAARLDSPHIVKVLELAPPGALVPYIAMELLHSTDLATRLRNENRLPQDELVILLDQVARGLEVARAAGIVHRDLKPHNIFNTSAGGWKILDFGVSKLLDGEGTLTGGGIVGTPQYMAPEQALGKDVDHLADVYALGAIAYRCVTGRSPFRGKDLAELVFQVVQTPPVRPSSLGRVSSSIEDVLAVAMAKDKTKRFRSALTFAQAFIAARRGIGGTLAVPDDAWS